MPLPTYAEVMSSLEKKRRLKHLLLGNGFSMSYDAAIFSYNALSAFFDSLKDQVVSRLFSVVNTKNFETVMRQLEILRELSVALEADPGFVARIDAAISQLRAGFLDAVKELHPEHVFTIPEQKSAACAKFLGEYASPQSSIFTTNYDILLYWVLMRNGMQTAIDGFGREAETLGEYVPEDEVVWSGLRWGKHREEQNVFYLHGALPLFDTGVEIEKEEYTDGNYLLENIKKRIEKGEYPIFVTAGSGRDKLTNIMHNRYLVYCYERLCSIQGSLVTFGFGFGEYDSHIIDAINTAAKHGKKTGDKLHSVYVGVYSEQSEKHMEQLRDRFQCKVNLFDSKTAPVWG